jgi:hypothetical protein
MRRLSLQLKIQVRLESKAIPIVKRALVPVGRIFLVFVRKTQKIGSTLRQAVVSDQRKDDDGGDGPNFRSSFRVKSPIAVLFRKMVG